MNDHYINKIKRIKSNFPKDSIKSIDILKKLKPKVKTQLIIPPITISKTKSLISKLSNSYATGWDNITNRILKKIPDTVAPFITHLFNSIIKKSLYPLVFKISKYSPQMKPDKDPFSPDLFRPINNLPTIETLFELLPWQFLGSEVLEKLSCNQRNFRSGE